MTPLLSDGHAAQPNAEVRVLLLDRQVNIGAQERFTHMARRVLNETGVQNGSKLSFDYDPSFQRLTLHFIRITRGTNSLNRLDRGRFNIIQQEKDLDRHLYNGTLSAVLFLDDVRIGDVIEYAYTVRGFNPVFEGKYADAFSLQWSVPLDRFYVRVLCPQTRNLSMKSHGRELEARIERKDGEIEYTWELKDVPGLIEEDSAPGWHDPYPWLQISEFQTWVDVARWALRLYPNPGILNDELKVKLNDWKTTGTDPEERLIAALDFVQREVRYLGIELGTGSHRPSDPNTVYARRFGDCKDKAYLLVTLLNELGFKASPALVNTVSRHTIEDWLPTPGAFDHAVVYVTIGDNAFWVDPTRSYQRGRLSARYFPDYGRALLVEAKTTNLTVVPFPTTGLPKTSVRETFFVKGRKEPVEFNVVTTAHGADADRLRDDLASSRREELEKNYLNFYARDYPTIEAARPMEVTDQAQENIVQTSEFYRIKEFWVLSEDKKTYECEFYPSTIRSLLETPDTRVRSAPLGIAHPVVQSLRTEVYLPEGWPVKDEKEVIENTAFKLTSNRLYKDNKLVFEYEYQSLTNSVAPGDVPRYIKKVDQAIENLGYSLTWDDEDAAADSPWSPSWILVVIGGLYLIPLLAAAGFIYRLKPRDLPPVIEPGHSPRLQGLRGWLILIGIGLVIAPLRISLNLFESRDVFSADLWHAVTAPGSDAFHPLWAAAIIFTLFADLTLLAGSILALLLYFQKRRVFPRFFIYFILGSAILTTIDHFGAKWLPNSESGPDELRALMRSYTTALIWIPYMLISKRVKATFVN